MEGQRSFVLFLVFASLFLSCLSASPYRVGAGIWDITGPAAEIGMMGYAQGNQSTAGIHFRLRARAMIIEDVQTSHRIAYVNLDLCFTTGLVKTQVLQQLEKLAPGYYKHDNVLITSTHTHSGPGGYSWYTLYDITTFGWHKSNVETIVSGIVQAVMMAHNRVTPGRLFLATGTLEKPLSNINRSPASYLNNPLNERKQFKYDVDKITITLRVQAENGDPIGVLNWFAVHGTSMNNWNNLISGDNKGYAMYLFERHINGNETFPGTGNFVAIFSNANEGDVTPNTRGGFCPDGSPCDPLHSTCNGKNEGCRATGPGWDVDIYGFESVRIIGSQQFDQALALYNSATEELKGGIRYVHQFNDMSKVTVTPEWTGLKQNVTTCLASLGDSFAAGTIDGPGDFDFVQGSNSTKDNPFWNAIAHFLSEPTQEQIDCQYPKPILLNIGGTDLPTPWGPRILPLQIVSIGHLYVVAVPGEFTTMSGRRLRAAVTSALLKNGAPKNLVVTISGLANEYSQYTATPEEYVVQRYEAASTLFGPNQLAAYIQLYSSLAGSLQRNETVDPGPTPKDYTSDLWDLQPGVIVDDGPIGEVKTQPKSSYQRGEQVLVAFHSANPRNNHRTQGTFLSVDKQQPDGSWKVMFVDGHWETKFHWKRLVSWRLGESIATITWDIPSWAEPGTYRIRHYGDKKSVFGGITEFVGTSQSFTVV